MASWLASTATPWVDYLTALSVIVASGAAPGTQLCAVPKFIVAIVALVEFPLVCYILKPKANPNAQANPNDGVVRAQLDAGALLGNPRRRRRGALAVTVGSGLCDM